MNSSMKKKQTHRQNRPVVVGEEGWGMTDWELGISRFQSPKKAMPKNAHTIAQLHSSHTLVK